MQQDDNTGSREPPAFSEAPAASLNEVNVSIAEAYEKGKTDFNFFAALCMPDICIYHLPDFYIAAWLILTSRSEDTAGKLVRFALGLPRGHAKTTFIKVLICWLI